MHRTKTTRAQLGAVRGGGLWSSSVAADHTAGAITNLSVRTRSPANVLAPGSTVRSPAPVERAHVTADRGRADRPDERC